MHFKITATPSSLTKLMPSDVAAGIWYVVKSEWFNSDRPRVFLYSIRVGLEIKSLMAEEEEVCGFFKKGFVVIVALTNP